MLGPWFLMAAYNHTGGELALRVPSKLPVSPFGYSHANLADFSISSSNIESLRFYCQTSFHSRKIHFTNNSPNVKLSAITGAGAFSTGDWRTPPVGGLYSAPLPDHTAALPASTASVMGPSLFDLPFYLS